MEFSFHSQIRKQQKYRPFYFRRIFIISSSNSKTNFWKLRNCWPIQFNGIFGGRCLQSWHLFFAEFSFDHQSPIIVTNNQAGSLYLQNSNRMSSSNETSMISIQLCDLIFYRAITIQLHLNKNRCVSQTPNRNIWRPTFEVKRLSSWCKKRLSNTRVPFTTKTAVSCTTAMWESWPLFWPF